MKLEAISANRYESFRNAFREALNCDNSEVVVSFLSALKTLETKKAAIVAAGTSYVMNALEVTVVHGNEKIANILLNALETPENKLEIIRNNNFSPFTRAAQNGHLEVAGLLFSSVAEQNRQPLLQILQTAPKNVREYIAVTNKDVDLEASPFADLNKEKITNLRELKNSLENKARVQSGYSNRVIGFLLRYDNLKQFSEEVMNVMLVNGVKSSKNSDEVNNNINQNRGQINTDIQFSIFSPNAPKFFTDSFGKEKGDLVLKTAFNFFAAPTLVRSEKVKNLRELRTSLENEGFEPVESNGVIGFLLRDDNLKQFYDEVMGVIAVSGKRMEINNDIQFAIFSPNAPKFFTDSFGKGASKTPCQILYLG